MLVSMAIVLPLGVSVAGPVGTAIGRVTTRTSGYDFWVDSDMGAIKSRIFRAADGNTNRVVYALDGMRARDDLNGWEIDTNVARALTAANINVVMPVGGQSSFYADWNAPSTFGPGDRLGWLGPGSAGSSGRARRCRDRRGGKGTPTSGRRSSRASCRARWPSGKGSAPPATACSVCRWVAAPR